MACMPSRGLQGASWTGCRVSLLEQARLGAWEDLPSGNSVSFLLHLLFAKLALTRAAALSWKGPMPAYTIASYAHVHSS